jgi:DNA-directed RNA polymerase subunit RPC12/RpoP
MVADSCGPAFGARAIGDGVQGLDVSRELAPWLRMPNPSEAVSTTLASSQPAATARSQPFMLSTRPMRDRPGRGGRPAMISSAPAICGTRRGLTKETTSIRCAPACSSRPMNSSRSSTVRITASFCSPSRGPTSTI